MPRSTQCLVPGGLGAVFAGAAVLAWRATGRCLEFPRQAVEAGEEPAGIAPALVFAGSTVSLAAIVAMEGRARDASAFAIPRFAVAACASNGAHISQIERIAGIHLATSTCKEH